MIALYDAETSDPKNFNEDFVKLKSVSKIIYEILILKSLILI